MGKVGLAVPSRSHTNLQPEFDPQIDTQKNRSHQLQPWSKGKLRRGRFFSPRGWIRIMTEFNRDVILNPNPTMTEFNRDVTYGVKAFASAFVLGTYLGVLTTFSCIERYIVVVAS